MTLLDEQILNKDEKLSAKKNRVITFMLTVVFRPLPSRRISLQYTLFQMVLFICIFALVASFERKYSFEFRLKNNATRANLQENKKNTNFAAILE